eukprot:2483478-Rhodomonas_salina.1
MAVALRLTRNNGGGVCVCSFESIRAILATVRIEEYPFAPKPNNTGPPPPATPYPTLCPMLCPMLCPTRCPVLCPVLPPTLGYMLLPTLCPTFCPTRLLRDPLRAFSALVRNYGAVWY